jgi:hypothetical protein
MGVLGCYSGGYFGRCSIWQATTKALKLLAIPA